MARENTGRKLLGNLVSALPRRNAGLFTPANKTCRNGVQFAGIAIDSADIVREFSIQYPTTYPLLIGGAEGVELTRQLGNPRLALPYTLIINPMGTVSFARLGGITEKELDTFLQQSTSR